MSIRQLADGTSIAKSFLESHSIENYKWIFEKKEGSKNGEVTKRN
jgi:hypothetical protein